MPRQSEGGAPATFVGGLTMSERVVDERQSRASDIIGVLSGVGLYSALIFLNLPVPIRSGLKPATDYGWEGYAPHATARVHVAARRLGGSVAVRGAGAAGQLDSNHHRADHCQRCFIANLDNREGRHRRLPRAGLILLVSGLLFAPPRWGLSGVRL